MNVWPTTMGSRGLAYPMLGLLFGGTAPLGLLAMRSMILGLDTTVRQEVRRDLPTYLYLAVSTPLVFSLLGRVLGRHADRLAALSRTDPLTGLANARAFYPRVAREIERATRSRLPLSLLLIDLDGLKRLNDRHGHAAGDRALRRIGRAIRGEMRSIDLGARLGGDEFGIIAVGASRTDGEVLARRLQSAISSTPAGGLGLRVTASIGLVTFEPSRHRPTGVQRLTRAADRALYAAKRGGRNRIETGDLDD